MSKVSLKYISESLGFSKSTISLVLNGRGDERRINKDTQHKIIQFAREHNYTANPLARSLSLGRSDTIGLIVPNIGDSFFSQIAMRIENKAEERGYQLLFGSTSESPEKEAKIIKSMVDRNVDGLIIVTSEKNHKEIQQLKNDNYPFVTVSRYYPDIQTNTVLIDEINGIASAVDHLVENGKHKIAFVTVDVDIESLKDRTQGYLQTMAKHNLVVADNYIQSIDFKDIAGGIEHAISALTQGNEPVDAIIFATQYLTVAALRVFNAKNIEVPAQISIVSYGYKSDFSLFKPTISGVNLPTKEMGDAAVELLLDCIEGKSQEYRSIVMPTELIVGESSKQ